VSQLSVPSAHAAACYSPVVAANTGTDAAGALGRTAASGPRWCIPAAPAAPPAAPPASPPRRHRSAERYPPPDATEDAPARSSAAHRFGHTVPSRGCPGRRPREPPGSTLVSNADPGHPSPTPPATRRTHPLELII